VFDLVYLGHAGWSIKHNDFKCLIDPWFGPQGAFLGQWYPFPQNYHLFTDSLLDDLDFIYISHAHEDHYDKWLLEKVDKAVPIYIADFADKTLRDGLMALGFEIVIEVRDEEAIELKNITIKIFKEEDSLDSDSCIVLNDGKNQILNLNDCHIEFSKLKTLEDAVDLLLIQTSSAIWWPCVYSYDTEKMRHHGRSKRESNLTRAAHYAKYVNAKMTIPNAGPPYFNDESMELWNYNKHKDWNPFVPSDDAVKYLRDCNRASELVIPGSTICLSGADIAVKTNEKEKEAIYGDIDNYTKLFKERLKEYALPKERATKAEIDSVVEKFSTQLKKIKKVSNFYANQIKVPVLFDFGQKGKWVADFTEESPLRPYSGGSVGYAFSMDPNSVALLFREKAIDFERYFLGCNFNCSRTPDIYNHFLFALLKNFDTKRLLASEKIYVSRNRDVLDETFIYKHESQTFEIQKYCPHMLADLEEIGFVNAKNEFVCPLHGWKFDLDSGQSINRKGECVKIREVVEKQ
tara:strand:- start:1670 stop:3223 length:1554 start_codon:yes stop_codon:yes gene_type:complete